MGVRRARTLNLAVAIAAGLVLSLRGQSPPPPARLQIENVGLPAIEEGAIWDQVREPGAAQTIRRAARSTAQEATRVGASGRSYTPGRVIVRFRDEVSQQERLDMVRGASATADLAARPPYADFDVIQINSAEDAERVAATLTSSPQVEYAQAAYRVHPTFVPNDPDYARLQWNLPLLNLERAWDIQPQAGSAITVAVLDTGMAYRDATLTVNIPAFRNAGINYPALGRSVIPYAAAPQLVGGNGSGRIVAPFDVISGGRNLPLDFDGHGTHVSGTIGQLTNDGLFTAGVAFNVKLMPVKVSDSFWDDLFGAPHIATDAAVARGIRYAADNGAKIINMSIGREGPPNTAPAVEDAMRYAVGRGAFIAIS